MKWCGISAFVAACALQPRVYMRRNKLTRLTFVSPRGSKLDVTRVAREHPHVALGLGDKAEPFDVIIDADEWVSGSSFAEFDHAVVRDGRDGGIVLRGKNADLCRVACEVLTRYQRFLQRRNAVSTSTQFDAVLQAHASLHDLARPLVAMDYDHAIDTWQWLLRLDPKASVAAQLAALFHDIERLESEPDRRVEHLSPEYQAFKVVHAKKGAEMAARVLGEVGFDDETCARVAEIIASHERRGRDADVDALNDADALSFFSLKSAGYADYYGPAQTERKVAHTLHRLSHGARERLSLVRLRRDVAHWLQEAAHQEAA
jgi:hypothetical protein